MTETKIQVESKKLGKQPHILGFHLCKAFRTDNSIETESRLVVSRGGRRGEMGVTAHSVGFLHGVMEVSELGSFDGFTI